MANFNLYISLPSDIVDGVRIWSEITVLPINTFTQPHIDDMLTVRFDWGELQLKNQPLNYRDNPINRYMLYDLINSLSPKDEVQFKFISPEFPDGIIGYFGKVDGDFNHDARLVKIKPTILDEYTPIMEGREKEIKLFDQHNVIKNSTFEKVSITRHTPEPTDWYIANDVYLRLDQGFLGNVTNVGISDDYNGHIADLGNTDFPTNSMEFLQTTPLFAKSSQLVFTFNYFLSGSSSRQKNLKCDILLNDDGSATVYRLKSDGSWVVKVPITTYSITYDQNRTPIDLTSFDNYRKKTYITNPTPVAGTIEVIFYRPVEANGSADSWDVNYKLNLTSVILSASEIQLKTIKVNFSDQNMVTTGQESDKIVWKDKQYDTGAKYFHKYAKNFGGSDFSNFIDNVTGEPKYDSLNNTDRSPSSANKIMYGDLLNMWESDVNHVSHGFELSELTIFEGKPSGGDSRWHGYAKFSREEVYKKDEFELDSQGNPTTNYIPPEIGGTWVRTLKTDKPDSDIHLWVRKPFDGKITTWKRGEVDTSATWRKFDGNFDYKNSLRTTKVYPIDAARSIEIKTAIDLRQLIQKVYRESSPELTGKNVYSSFFWNDCEAGGVLPDAILAGQLGLINYPTSNYFTGEKNNPLNRIVAIHTYDLSIDTSVNQEKSILKATFKKLMDDLIVKYRKHIYWFVDSDLNLHIEHIKYFDKINSPLEMRVSRFAYIRNYEQFKFDKSQMYSLEEYEVKNSGYNDFKTSKVTFDKIPSNKRGEDLKESFSTQLLSTDIQFCVENAESIENGIILLAYDVVDDENIVRYGIGQKTTESVINGDLSISSLLAKYGTYEGTWETGKINDRGFLGKTDLDDVFNFSYTKRMIEGKEVTFKGILTDNLVRNNLGDGVVKSKTIDYNNQLTKVILNHRYEAYIPPVSMGNTNEIPQRPSVSTIEAIVTLSLTSVTLSGNVTSDGGATVTERGISYSQYPGAEIYNGTHVASESGLGSFDATLTGLSQNTNYYFRAYAINSVGTTYGGRFTFEIASPSVTTSETISGITDVSATVGGEVVSIGGSAVTERGIVYSTTPLNLTILDNKVISGSGIGIFTVNLTGLIAETRYYLRAYAINSSGVTYGYRIHFDTEPPN